MKVSLPHVHVFRDRHGKVRCYYRRPGRKAVALAGVPGSPEFVAAYHAASAGIEIEQRVGAAAPGSVSATIAVYYTDNAFLALAPTTRSNRRAILERFRSAHGDKSIVTMKQHHVAQLLGQMRPFAARNWLKVLRGLMQFAVRIGLRPDDPTAGIKLAKAKAGTIHTWSEDEIAAFERHHAVGTRARLALALLLYTAARRGDVVGFGPQHVRAGRLYYRQQKTGRALAIPVHPALAEVLAATPTKHLTFLVAAGGKPFAAAGFGNWFRACCDEAGLPQCSAHGLRKAQARRLAEAGCSAHEIASITGHRTLAEVQRYADAASQEHMADAAMRTVSRTRLANLRDDLANPAVKR